jgi:hypothetical protein
VSFVAACQPVIKETTSQRMIITNEVIRTSVVGESDFTMVIDGVVLKAEPVDARMFDGNKATLRAIAFDGGFSVVDVSVSFEDSKADTSTKLDVTTRGLLTKLIDSGIRHEHSMAIVRQITEEFASTTRHIIAENDYHVESIVKADISNPFTFDQRYLTLFKLTLSNTGNLMKEFCLPTVRLHTTTNVYEPFEMAKLLDEVPYGSVKHEVLNQLMVSTCTVLPPQTTIDRYLPFPSVSQNNDFRLTVQTGNQLNSVKYSVKRSSSFERYVFNPARILTKESGAVVIPMQSTTPGVVSYSELTRSSFIFLESEDEMTRVDNSELIVQENMDPGVYQIIVVQRQGDVYTVTRVPLDPSTLVDGVILVELGG